MIRSSIALFQSYKTAPLNVDKRPFFKWLTAIFNNYDEDRIQSVGPDRAAAEWLLRCGGSVKWVGGGNVSDYNSLPAGNYRKLKIEFIDATGASIMENGFPYLEHLKELKGVKLSKNPYILDETFKLFISYSKNKLEVLEVSDNGDLTEDSLLFLQKMQTLKLLRLENLTGVENPQKTIDIISSALPKCRIVWPPYTDKVD